MLDTERGQDRPVASPYPANREGSVDQLIRDIRYGLRTLRHNSGFAGIAVLALALGIGANSAIFGVVNAVLLRPLPYKQPDRLVMLWGNVKRQVVERRGASWPDYIDWRERSTSFEG